MTQIQQQVRQVFPTLPEEIKTLLLSPDFNDRIEIVAKKHGFNEDQTGTLIRITARLLIGVISPSQFVSSIIENTEVERETASFVAQEINRDIFNPIKDALIELHSVDKSNAVQQVASPTERPLGTAAIVPSAPIVPDLSVLPAHANDPIPVARVAPSIAAAVAPYIPLAAVSKPLPSFSVAQALGNIPSTGSSQSSTEESEMPKAHVGTIAASATDREQSGNILEDKLGGSYRMKTETSNSVGTPTLPLSPTQVIPPPPQATKAPAQAQEKSALAKALDPYREAPL